MASHEAHDLGYELELVDGLPQVHVLTLGVDRRGAHRALAAVTHDQLKRGDGNAIALHALDERAPEAVEVLARVLDAATRCEARERLRHLPTALLVVAAAHEPLEQERVLVLQPA